MVYSTLRIEACSASSKSSTMVDFLSDLEPRIHRSVDLTREKQIFVRMAFVATAVETCRLSAIISLNLAKKTAHSLPMPPFAEKTRGVNEPFSISKTRSL